MASHSLNLQPHFKTGILEINIHSSSTVSPFLGGLSFDLKISPQSVGVFS